LCRFGPHPPNSIAWVDDCRLRSNQQNILRSRTQHDPTTDNLANLTAAATALLGTTASAAPTPLTSTMMLRRLMVRFPTSVLCSAEKMHTPILGERPLPLNLPSQTFFRTFLDLHQIAMANNTIIPSSTAVKFPDLEVSFTDGRCVKLPIDAGQTVTDTSQMRAPHVSLLCLSFRASSLGMVESWILPFRDAFSDAGTVQICEVSFIDSWLFSLGPARRLILKMMRKSNDPHRQVCLPA
ncbi:ATP10 protein, partial [Musa troglodytarum]